MLLGGASAAEACSAVVSQTWLCHHFFPTQFPPLRAHHLDNPGANCIKEIRRPSAHRQTSDGSQKLLLIPLLRPACQFLTAHPCGQKCSFQSIQRIRRPLMSSYAHPSLNGVDSHKDHTLPTTVSSTPFLVALEAHRRLDGPPYSRRGLSAMRRSSPLAAPSATVASTPGGHKLTCGFERSPCERIPSERQPTR